MASGWSALGPWTDLLALWMPTRIRAAGPLLLGAADIAQFQHDVGAVVELVGGAPVAGQRIEALAIGEAVLGVVIERGGVGAVARDEIEAALVEGGLPGVGVDEGGAVGLGGALDERVGVVPRVGVDAIVEYAVVGVGDVSLRGRGGAGLRRDAVALTVVGGMLSLHQALAIVDKACAQTFSLSVSSSFRSCLRMAIANFTVGSIRTA
jgi:hypothetical protein